MAKRNEGITWAEVDVSALPKKQRDLYTAYKAQAAKASEARKAFEASFTSAQLTQMHGHIVSAGGIVAGGQPLWSHQFGKLSLAFGEERQTAGKVGKIKL